MPPCHYLEVNDPNIIPSLIGPNVWYWKEASGDKRILTSNMTAHVQAQLFREYCHMRDQYRRAVPIPHAASSRPRRSRIFPILEIPGFVISRTPRQPAPRSRHGTTCPDRQLRQTRIRLTSGSLSPGGAPRAPPTLGLCYIQELWPRGGVFGELTCTLALLEGLA